MSRFEMFVLARCLLVVRLELAPRVELKYGQDGGNAETCSYCLFAALNLAGRFHHTTETYVYETLGATSGHIFNDPGGEASVA